MFATDGPRGGRAWARGTPATNPVIMSNKVSENCQVINLIKCSEFNDKAGSKYSELLVRIDNTGTRQTSGIEFLTAV